MGILVDCVEALSDGGIWHNRVRGCLRLAMYTIRFCR